MHATRHIMFLTIHQVRYAKSHALGMPHIILGKSPAHMQTHLNLQYFQLSEKSNPQSNLVSDKL